LISAALLLGYADHTLANQTFLKSDKVLNMKKLVNDAFGDTLSPLRVKFDNDGELNNAPMIGVVT